MQANNIKAVHQVAARKIMSAAILCALGTSAYAQSSVTVYGLLETGIRHQSNVDAAGNSNNIIGDGLINPSRLGFKGAEDLGDGMKAIFDLEAGLTMKNGAGGTGGVGYYNDTGGGLFGREAWVGLDGGFGKVTVGRQYTTAYKQTWGFDPIYGGGLHVFTPYIFYTGVRQDNMVSYEKSLGAVTLGGHYVFGENSADSSLGRGYGIGASFSGGGFNLNAAYQEANNTSAAGAAATAAPVGATKQKVGVLGGAYSFGAAKVSLGYIANSYQGVGAASDRKNGVVVTSFVYSAAPWTFTATADYDKYKSTPVGDGAHTLVVGLVDYALSKRTALFAAVDYNKYKDAAKSLAVTSLGAAGPDNQLGLTLGMRHAF